MRMMKKRFAKYRNILLLWLLLTGSPICAVGTYTPATMPSSWTTTPTMSNDMQTVYQFRSTSSYVSSMNTRSTMITLYGRVGASSMRKAGYWNEDGEWVPGDNENPIGDVDPPAPVGSPFVLLALALAYVLKKRLSRLRLIEYRPPSADRLIQ